MKIGLTAYDLSCPRVPGAGQGGRRRRVRLALARRARRAPDRLRTTLPPEHWTPGEQHHSGPIIDPDTELVDPLVMLGAAAAVTSRLRLATGIYILPLRHPLATARSACTVQELAEGRFVMGVGSGWLAEEFAALDQPFDDRSSRFEESIAVLRAAWRGGELIHDGASLLDLRGAGHQASHVDPADPRWEQRPGVAQSGAARRWLVLVGYAARSTMPSACASALDRLRHGDGRGSAGSRSKMIFRIEGCDPAVAATLRGRRLRERPDLDRSGLAGHTARSLEKCERRLTQTPLERSATFDCTWRRLLFAPASSPPASAPLLRRGFGAAVFFGTCATARPSDRPRAPARQAPCSSLIASCRRSTRIHRSGTRSRSPTKPKSS